MCTKEQLIKCMEDSNLLMKKKMTFVEYADELVKFQDYITKFVLKEEYEEGMRLDEVIFRLESKARKNGISNDETFRKGINALKLVSKEVAISMAGKKGENIVSRTLEFVERPKTTIYKNVYLSDEREETEIDTLILTDSGIMLLEVKNVKDDITISKQGRLVHSGDECYDKVPLTVKMAKKRRLLKNRLENMLAEKGINIPIWIDSYVVFSSPKGMRINVNDMYRKEKWIFRSELKYKVENYLGGFYYNNEQLQILDNCISTIESCVKRFELTVDYDEVRNDIASVLVLFEDKPIVSKAENNAGLIDKKSNMKVAMNDDCKVVDITNQRKRQVVVAGMLTGIACVSAFIGATVLTGRKLWQ